MSAFAAESNLDGYQVSVSVKTRPAMTNQWDCLLRHNQRRIVSSP